MSEQMTFIRIWSTDGKFPQVLSVINETSKRTVRYKPIIFCTVKSVTNSQESAIGHSICSNCQKSIRPSANYCSNCGAQVVTAELDKD